MSDPIASCLVVLTISGHALWRATAARGDEPGVMLSDLIVDLESEGHINRGDAVDAQPELESTTSSHPDLIRERDEASGRSHADTRCPNQTRFPPPATSSRNHNHETRPVAGDGRSKRKSRKSYRRRRKVEMTELNQEFFTNRTETDQSVQERSSS